MSFISDWASDSIIEKSKDRLEVYSKGSIKKNALLMSLHELVIPCFNNGRFLVQYIKHLFSLSYNCIRMKKILQEPFKTESSFYVSTWNWNFNTIKFKLLPRKINLELKKVFKLIIILMSLMMENSCIFYIKSTCSNFNLLFNTLTNFYLTSKSTTNHFLSPYLFIPRHKILWNISSQFLQSFYIIIWYGKWI